MSEPVLVGSPTVNEMRRVAKDADPPAAIPGRRPMVGLDRMTVERWANEVEERDACITELKAVAEAVEEWMWTEAPTDSSRWRKVVDALAARREGIHA